MSSGSGARKGAVLVGLGLAVLLGVPLGVWFARDAIATSVAEDALAARGLRCDERLHVSLSATGGEATVGPTRCALEGGLLEAVELLGPVRVTLDGFEPASVDGASVRLALRDREVRGGAGWAAALGRLDLEQRVAGLVKGLAEVGSLELPPTRLGRVQVVQADAPIARGTQLTLTPARDGTRLSMRELVLPARVGQLRLTDLEGQAASDRVTLRGQARAETGLGSLLGLSAGGAFTLEASRLQTSSPQLRLRGL